MKVCNGIASSVSVRDRIRSIVQETLSNAQTTSFVLDSPVRDRIRWIVTEYFPDTVKIVEGFKFPKSPSRIPVTPDFVATVVSGKSILKDHPAAGYLDEALYESVRKMVYMLAERYSRTCAEDTEDLAQECYKRIVEKIGQFDPKLGKFSTWTWRVCSSILNRRYHRNLGRRDHTVEANEMFENQSDAAEAVAVSDRSAMLGVDIIETVNALAVKYPKQERLIRAMFGNPVEKGFFFPSKVLVAEAAHEVGVEYTAAYVFYCRKVRPFFRKRFGGECHG